MGLLWAELWRLCMVWGRSRGLLWRVSSSCLRAHGQLTLLVTRGLQKLSLLNAAVCDCLCTAAVLVYFVGHHATTFRHCMTAHLILRTPQQYEAPAIAPLRAAALASLFKVLTSPPMFAGTSHPSLRAGACLLLCLHCSENTLAGALHLYIVCLRVALCCVGDVCQTRQVLEKRSDTNHFIQ